MNDSDSPWEIISSEYLHKAPWLTVRKDHVVLPNGNHIPSYYILEYPDWVNTIAITRDGQFVFIRQYRHGLQETSYELCAGVCEEEDASPLISAQRELLEETGYGNGTCRNTCKSPPTRVPIPILRIAFWLPMWKRFRSSIWKIRKASAYICLRLQK